MSLNLVAEGIGGLSVGFIAVVALVLLVIILLASCIKIVPQATAYAVSYTHLDVYKRQG